MINKDFIRQTDELIQKIKERKLKLWNGNILIAKVKMDRITSGGLHLADDYIDVEEFKRGFGRILALPEGYPQEGDADVKVGEYVVYPHQAPFLPYRDALQELLGTVLENKTYYTIQDNEVLMNIPAEVLHAAV